MKIFDCFCFLNELEILELRLMELNDVVDYFVIVEANRSHNGTPKELIFEKNKDRYKEWLHKIIYVKVEDMPEYDPKEVFRLEYFQRNAIMRGLDKAKKGDKIIVSDLDEIVNPDAIRENLDNDNWVSFSQELFYYYVNNRNNRAWCRPVMANFGSFGNRPNKLRMFSKGHLFRRRGKNVASNGGWHYSYMTGGDAERVKKKVSLFAEKQLSVAAGTPKEIAEKMANQKDLFNRERYNRPGAFEIVDISNNKPKMLDKWLEKYPDFIYKL